MKLRDLSGVKANISIIVMLGLVVTTCIVSYFYFAGDGNTRLAPLLASSVAGLIMVTIQFALEWHQYRANERIMALGVQDIRDNRDTREYYSRLIGRGVEQILVMGVTANRFMEDFADVESVREESRVALRAMDRGVHLKILIPYPKYLLRDEERDNSRLAERHFHDVKEKYPNLFEVKFFEHVPAHSMVVVDDQYIIGPVFPNVRSKETPCIIMRGNSTFVRKYREYFDHEWSNAKSC